MITINGIIRGFCIGAFLVGTAGSLSAESLVNLSMPLSSVGVSHQETTLGDLIADSVRDTTGADIALIPADEITETTIPSGNISLSRLQSVLRYANDPTDTISELSLTGKQLIEALNRSVSRAPQPFDGFFQVSGVTFHFSSTQPMGKQVTDVSVDGAPIEAGSTYTVATTLSAADGSYGYFSVWNKSDIKQSFPSTLSSALSQYVTVHKSVDSGTQNRITS